MVNTNNILKELLAKIEELKNREKVEISREAQLKIIERIQEIEKVKREKRILEGVSLDYLREIVDKKLEINKMNKELEEKELLIKDLKVKFREEEEKALTHLDGIKVCEDWYFTHHINPLNKEVADKSEKIETANKNLEIKDEQIKTLQTELEEKTERVEKITEKFEKLETTQKETENLLYLANKPLPALPKETNKQNKLQQLIKKIKVKFQQSIKRKESQEQKMIARIEVK